jgi:ferrochelatase
MLNDTKTGVVLLNLGGPDSLDAVKPFLYNLFCDPEIINFPLSFLFRKRLAKLISDKRSPKVILQYKELGGKSPLAELTFRQADALERALKNEIDCKVYTAMRYWHPFTDEVIEQIKKDKIKRVVLLPLYPQYSKSTTGSSVNEWNRLAAKDPLMKNIEVHTVEKYYDHPGYLDSIIENIGTALEKFPREHRNDFHIIFSAHGTPIKLVKEGDPYKYHIENTVSAVVNRAQFSQRYHLSYQSKVGPQRWLEPKTPDVIEKLAGEGVKYLLIVPIAFVSDHLETLYEIGIEFRYLAKRYGIEQFEVMPALNDSPKFISALKDLVLKTLSKKEEIDVGRNKQTQ